MKISCAAAKTQGSQINDLTHTHTDSGGLEKFQDKDMKTDTPWGTVALCTTLCGGSVVKNLPADAGDAGSIPGLGRCPEERYNNRLQYACLGNPMDRGTWWATAHGITKNQTQLSDWAPTTHKA